MILKPLWLVNFLNALNWDVFTWHIYVGDTVETAIDWVLDGINTIITWAEQVGAWLDELRQEILDFFELIPQWINEVWEFLLNFFDSIGTIIADWWSATYQIVKDWVNTIIDLVRDALKVVSDTVTEWISRVEAFFTNILPTLASLFDVDQLIKSAFAPWVDLFNFWGNLAAEIGAFFSDPYDFIYQRLERWIDRFLGRYL